MDLLPILRSEKMACILGAAGVGVLSAIAYWQIGWLGVGLIGLVGLIISTQIDLYGGHAFTDTGLGSGDVPLYAKQLEARRSQSSPEEKMAIAAEQAKRSKGHHLFNTIFIGITALGFGLFVLHQLP